MTRAQQTAEPPVPPRPPVTIKGRGEGLRIVVVHAEPTAIMAGLRQQVQRKAAAFFAGAEVTLQLPPGPLDLQLAARMAQVIESAGMRLIAVTNRADDEAGHGRAASAPSAVAAVPRPASGAPGDAALVVTATLRSGQRITHDGAVVVVGDVNPGAEILAGGSVIVWGRLRGTVEAGLAGDAADTVVCALDLAPTQLRIGPALARAPEEPDRTPVPEVAREVAGQIVVDAWR
jgi:septum site-determining protein MinC